MGMATSGPCAGQIGVSSPVQSFGSQSVVGSTYVAGPLPELVNGLLQAGVKQVLACRIFSGTISATSTTAFATSTASVSWSGHPMGPYGAAVSSGLTGGPIIKVSTSSGSSTAGQIQISLDGGNTYSSPMVATTAPYLIPNTGITITFSAVTGSGVLVATETCSSQITASAGSIGAVAQQNLISGSPQGAGGVAVSAAAAGPADQYELVVQILTQGGLTNASATAATFTWTDSTDTDSITFTAGTGFPGALGNNLKVVVATGVALANSIATSGGITTVTLTINTGTTTPALLNTYVNTTAAATLAQYISISAHTGTTPFSVFLASTALTGGVNAPAPATFKYSLDGGNTFSGALAIPSTGTYAVGEAGELTLTFSNTGGVGTGAFFQPNDQYLCAVTGPYYTTTDYTNVMAQVLASPTQFGFIHLCGRPTTAANAYTLFGFIDTQMLTAASGNRFIRTLMEMPANINGSGDAAAIAAFSNPASTSLRVGVSSGDVNFSTPDGLQLQRCCSWAAAAATALARPGQDIAWVGAGSIADVADILRDESVLQSLDQYGFITTRTWFGKQGYFFTSAQDMGAIGTNFQYWALGRVMDEALTATYQALLPYVNQGLLASATTGLIDPRQAAEINNDCNVAMYNALNLAQASAGGADASGAQFTVDQSANIAATGILPGTVAVEALLYGRQITVTAGFTLKLAA